jgi:hypothetical protein
MPKRRWKDIIKMDLTLTGYDMDWIHLARDRDRWWAVVNTAMKILDA